MPFAYFKGYSDDFRWYENGATVGASWLYEGGFLAGLRWSRLGHLNATSLVVGWGSAD